MAGLRSLISVSLIGVITALLLSFVVYITLGTRWGFETYLFPYLIGVSLLPLVGALVTSRYRLVVPSLLLSAGVVTFVAGVTGDLFCLQGAANSWGFTYDLGRNVIRFGPDTAGTLACRAELNAPLVILGYVLTTIGGIQSLDDLASQEWLSVNLYSLLDIR